MNQKGPSARPIMGRLWRRCSPAATVALILVPFLMAACSSDLARFEEGLGDTSARSIQYDDVRLYDDARFYDDRHIEHPPLPDHASLSGRLKAFFSPHDSLRATELALIDEVIEARRADSRHFSRDENPYRIHYAVYNLRGHDIVDALIQARREGVEVRVLVDSAQIDPVNRPWNTAYEYLARHGFIVEESDDWLDEEERRGADVLGISVEGLMHLKLRLFKTPQFRRALTGSGNPGDNISINDDSLLLINDPEITTIYRNAWQAIYLGRELRNWWEFGAPVNVMFSSAQGMSAGGRILNWLEEEDEQILLKVFSLRDFGTWGTSETLISILARKVEEGVPVYVLTDIKQSGGPDGNEPTVRRLREAGVRVYEVLNSSNEFAAMHHKAAVLGRTRLRVIAGSANWSRSALGFQYGAPRNVEDVIFIDSHAFDDGYIGRRYLSSWLDLLERYAHQSVELNGEAPSHEVYELLSTQSGWPTQPVSFSATAEIDTDERLFVEGDHYALGSWGEDHPGLRLTTSQSHYPRWWSMEPAGIPVGASVNWRLKAASPDGTGGRLEPCDPRTGLAMPAPYSKEPVDWFASWCEGQSCTTTADCAEYEICLDTGVCQCMPMTCAELGVECGLHDDGCGGTVDCGDCELESFVVLDEALRDGQQPSGFSADGVSWETAAGGYARFRDEQAFIETPVLDLSGYAHVSLEFDVAKWGEGENGPITVEVSDDGGSTWTATVFDSPTPTSSSYMTSGPTPIHTIGDEVVIRFVRTASPSEKRLRNLVLVGYR